MEQENKNYFKGANVYIDSFYSFTKSQLDVIKEIFKQAQNEIRRCFGRLFGDYYCYCHCF